MIQIIVMSIVLVALIIGSVTDIKKREVPDWISYGLIFLGIGLRGIFSLTTKNFSYLIEGFTGLLVFVALAFLMYYLGQWGGGDSKILMGMGAIIGLELSFESFMVSFIINLVFIGGLYSLILASLLALKHRKKLVKQINNLFSKKEIKIIRIFVISVTLVSIILFLILKNFYSRFIIGSLGVMILITFYLWVFIKSIETTVMLKSIKPTKLVEGDWIAKKIKIDGKDIAGPKDLGVTKQQIKLLVNYYKKNKIKTVIIKEGLPFLPAFLISYVCAIIWGNLLILLV